MAWFEATKGTKGLLTSFSGLFAELWFNLLPKSGTAYKALGTGLKLPLARLGGVKMTRERNSVFNMRVSSATWKLKKIHGGSGPHS